MGSVKGVGIVMEKAADKYVLEVGEDVLRTTHHSTYPANINVSFPKAFMASQSQPILVITPSRAFAWSDY